MSASFLTTIVDRLRYRRLQQRPPDWVHVRMALTRLSEEIVLYRHLYVLAQTPQDRAETAQQYWQKRHAQQALALAVFSRDVWRPRL